MKTITNLILAGTAAIALAGCGSQRLSRDGISEPLYPGSVLQIDNNFYGAPDSEVREFLDARKAYIDYRNAHSDEFTSGKLSDEVKTGLISRAWNAMKEHLDLVPERDDFGRQIIREDYMNLINSLTPKNE